MITFKNTHITPLRAWEKHMNILLISALLLGGCKTTDPVATPEVIYGDSVKTVKTKDYDKLYKKDNNSSKYIAVGDTIIPFAVTKLHTPPSKDPDLIKIKNDKEATLKGKPLTMVIIGGSMSAGVRDGGYFNDGISTSYPNMVARQMKLKKFEQPVFDATQFNGIGRRVKTGFNPTGGPIQKFNVIQNNLTGEYLPGEQYDLKKIKLPDYRGESDNLAIPFSSRSMLNSDGEWGGFKDRILNKKNSRGEIMSVINHLKLKKVDFFVLETGLDDLISFVHTGGGAIWGSNVPESAKDYTFQDNLTIGEELRIQPELKLMREVLVPLGSKGVLLNIPDILQLPYFLSKDYVSNFNLQIKEVLERRYFLNDVYAFMPSSRVDSLLGVNVHPAIKPVFNEKQSLKGYRDYVLKEAMVGGADYVNIGTQRMNDQLLNFSKKWGFGIVDIRSLYKKIIGKTGFIADDGSVINTTNFFSNDGINPTPLGQAVIANEVIKTINATYKTDIPLISVREYLSVK